MCLSQQRAIQYFSFSLVPLDASVSCVISESNPLLYRVTSPIWLENIYGFLLFFFRFNGISELKRACFDLLFDELATVCIHRLDCISNEIDSTCRSPIDFERISLHKKTLLLSNEYHIRSHELSIHSVFITRKKNLAFIASLSPCCVFLMVGLKCKA